MIEKFTTLTTTVVPLNRENVDTDQIIPARFLKATTKDGFGANLFADWRVASDFVLNTRKGQVLVAGHNFGCGSSREHAAWAICGAGFRAVISTHFADIFRNNALNNGLLPIEVSASFLARLMKAGEKDTVTIDLENQTVTFGGIQERFEVNAYKKTCLLNGYDDVDYLLSVREKIEMFEKKRMLCK